MNQWIELEKLDGTKCLVDMKDHWEIVDAGDSPAHWQNDSIGMNRFFKSTYSEIKAKLFAKESE